MVGEPLAAMLAAGQQNRVESLRAAKRIMKQLRASVQCSNPWFSDQATIAVLLDALVAGLPRGREPGQTAVPTDRGEEVLTSLSAHPQAMKWRMQHVSSTPAGRGFLRQLPQLAVRSGDTTAFLSDRSGEPHRAMADLCAVALCHDAGRQSVRQAAMLAQRAYTTNFWAKRPKYIPRIIVGNGPAGLAVAHGLLEAGDVGKTIVLSNSEWAGGPFAWGNFRVNHRNRPTDPAYRAAPATQGTLDGLGQVLVNPHDLSGTWGYNDSSAVAASCAMNALGAGPVVTAEMLDWVGDPLTNTVRVTVRNPLTDQLYTVVTSELILATGLGTPRSLPGDATSLSIRDFLQHPDPHRLGEVVTVVGDRDSASIVGEELLNVWDRPGIARAEQTLRKIVWVRPSGRLYKETAAFCDRGRYSGPIAPFLPRLTDSEYPSVIEVRPGRVCGSFDGVLGPSVVVENNGEASVLICSNAIVNATGFSNPFADRFSGPTEGVFYSDGLPVGRQLAPGVTIVGAGADIPISPLELRLFPILREPALGVNSAALFRNILTATLLGKERAKRLSAQPSSLPQVRPRRSRGRAAGPIVGDWSRPLLPPDAMRSVNTDLPTLLRARLQAIAESVSQLPHDELMVQVGEFGQSGLSLVCENVTQVLIERVLEPVFTDFDVQHMLGHQYAARADAAIKLASVLDNAVSDQTITIRIPVRGGRIDPLKLSIV